MSVSNLPPTMKAFVAKRYGGPDVLQQVTLPVPRPTGRDVLVRNRAVATNPIDYKKLNNFGHSEAPVTSEGGVLVGFDSAGVVAAVGPEVTLYRVGDEVFFAGQLSRAGSFAEYTLVDERIVGRKPKSLSWIEAASLPLVGLTAWEGLVEELRIPVPQAEVAVEEKTQPDSILTIGGAGGVGSLVIQLAKHVLKLHVIATASRPETSQWCQALGADLVLDHSKPLLPQLNAHGLNGVKYIYNTVDTAGYFEQEVDLILPFGAILNITGTDQPLAVGKFFHKRVAFLFEFMFARPEFNHFPQEQKKTLDLLSQLVDAGVIKHVLTTKFPFTLEGLQAALRLQVSAKAVGKVALSNEDE